MTDEMRARSQGRADRSDAELARATPPLAGGREVRIGVFVILGILGVLGALFLLTDPGTFRGRYNLVTVVENAGGVRKGDPVQMRGVNIGRVRDFTLEGSGVAILLEVNGRWQVPTDSRAKLAGVGLLGGRTVEILPGVATTALSPGSRLPGVAETDVMELASVIGFDVEELLDRMKILLDANTIDAVQGTAGDARLLVAELRQLVEGQRRDLEAAVGSLRRSAEGVEEVATSPEFARTVARADSTLVTLQAAGERLDGVAESLAVVIGRMERGEGTLGLLSADETLYRNLTSATASLETLLEDVRENPSRYIRVRIF
jgi:phospholipid/cholesterol/gamma-HCH transport system substrate-binding protein